MSDHGVQIAVKEGDVIAGKYRVERVIGVGGMGVVVAATHMALHKQVALKLMLPTALANAETVERFVREARAAAQLRSEHVARVLDVGTRERGEPFIVMELLEGRDLEEVLRRHGALPIPEAVDVVRQACDALEEAHGRGIVHRDLKPGNLFLATDARGRTQVKVLDFGISKATGPGGGVGDLALTKTTAVMGSPLYMSPEQMRATRNVDARSDIWSLGVTLYQLLCGEVPFFTESAMELGAKVMYEEPVPPRARRPEIPPALEAVVLRCLAKDPAARFASARELARALEAALGGHHDVTSGMRVLVATGSAADASSALPFSHTALAHGGTGNGAPRPRSRARSVLFASLVIGTAATAVIALRVRAPSAAPPVAASDDARRPVASVDPLPPPITDRSPEPDVAAPTAPSATPAPGASSAEPRARPKPPPARRDRVPPRASATNDAPPAPPANPLDHL